MNIIPIFSEPFNQTTSINSSPVSYSTTKQILENKRPTIGEIELTLFENCNINCNFCFHDKKSTIGLSTTEINSKLPLIQQFMHKRQNTVELMQINVVGGELFQDRYMERLCCDYINLAKQIKRLANQYNHKLRIVWVSNFLFKKSFKVRQMIDTLRTNNIDTHLIVSYDFDGRPISNQYKNNISYFGPEYIISVNLVGTTQSIHKFMLDDDDYFKQLYKTYNIYFDDFIPDKGTDNKIPTDSLMYQWYTFIADNYPKIEPVAGLIHNRQNQMHCLSLNKITIFPDNRISNCRWYRYDQSDFNTKFDIKDNAGMMQQYIDTMGCLSCEYYNKCGFRCFTQWDWSNRVADMNDPKCPIKAFFNYITKGISWKKT